jgi:hypothetical protein
VLLDGSGSVDMSVLYTITVTDGQDDLSKVLTVYVLELIDRLTELLHSGITTTNKERIEEVIDYLRTVLYDDEIKSYVDQVDLQKAYKAYTLIDKLTELVPDSGITTTNKDQVEYVIDHVRNALADENIKNTDTTEVKHTANETLQKAYTAYLKCIFGSNSVLLDGSGSVDMSVLYTITVTDGQDDLSKVLTAYVLELIDRLTELLHSGITTTNKERIEEVIDYLRTVLYDDEIKSYVDQVDLQKAYKAYTLIDKLTELVPDSGITTTNKDQVEYVIDHVRNALADENIKNTDTTEVKHTANETLQKAYTAYLKCIFGSESVLLHGSGSVDMSTTYDKAVEFSSSGGDDSSEVLTTYLQTLIDKLTELVESGITTTNKDQVKGFIAYVRNALADANIKNIVTTEVETRANDTLQGAYTAYLECEVEGFSAEREDSSSTNLQDLYDVLTGVNPEEDLENEITTDAGKFHVDNTLELIKHYFTEDIDLQTELRTYVLESLLSPGNFIKENVETAINTLRTVLDDESTGVDATVREEANKTLQEAYTAYLECVGFTLEGEESPSRLYDTYLKIVKYINDPTNSSEKKTFSEILAQTETDLSEFQTVNADIIRNYILKHGKVSTAQLSELPSNVGNFVPESVSTSSAFVLQDPDPDFTTTNNINFILQQENPITINIKDETETTIITCTFGGDGTVDVEFPDDTTKELEPNIPYIHDGTDVFLLTEEGLLILPNLDNETLCGFYDMYFKAVGLNPGVDKQTDYNSIECIRESDTSNFSDYANHTTNNCIPSESVGEDRRKLTKYILDYGLKDGNENVWDTTKESLLKFLIPETYKSSVNSLDLETEDVQVRVLKCSSDTEVNITDQIPVVHLPSIIGTKTLQLPDGTKLQVRHTDDGLYQIREEGGQWSKGQGAGESDVYIKGKLKVLFIWGSCTIIVDTNHQASAGADPYIFPCVGPAVKLPNVPATYRLYQDSTVVINAKVAPASYDAQEQIAALFAFEDQDCFAPITKEAFFFSELYIGTLDQMYHVHIDLEHKNVRSSHTGAFFTISPLFVDRSPQRPYEMINNDRGSRVSFHIRWPGMYITLSFSRNPQVRNGLSLVGMNPARSMGLLVQNYRPKLFTVPQLEDVHPVVLNPNCRRTTTQRGIVGHRECVVSCRV